MRRSRATRRTWRSKCLAWLGIAAFALNALVPVHLAFDLAAELGASHARGAHAAESDKAAPRLDRRLFALLSLHRDAGDDGGRHHGKHGHHSAACAVCSAVGALAAIALAAAPTLAAPPAAAAAIEAASFASENAAGFAAGYRSRAPPLA